MYFDLLFSNKLYVMHALISHFLNFWTEHELWHFFQGGEATRDEMCLDFLFYYPNIKEFQFCQNWLYEPSFKFIKKYL